MPGKNRKCPNHLMFLQGALGMDLFYFKKIDFLLVVYYFSEFLVVGKLPNSTLKAVSFL